VDIEALSIHANDLKQKGSDVLHGNIRELSLVLTGANPGALIDNLTFQHSNGSTETDDNEAIIYSGSDVVAGMLNHADEGKTVQDVFDTLNEEQKTVVYAMLTEALDNGQNESMSQSSENNEEEKNEMKHNVFEKKSGESTKNTLTHAQCLEIFSTAQKCGSLKDAFLQHTVTYGIENIDFLFPDAKSIGEPSMIDRDQSWVQGVLSGTNHSAFSRIKMVHADITADEARALGYIKGGLKKEEVITLLKRITAPQTIYKKQKLDRDDIIDITDLDIVAWLRREMRGKLDEELARAVLIGDGRSIESTDKIKEDCIRPIWKDSVLYSHKVTLDSTKETEDIIEAIIRSRTEYKGSGNPALYITPTLLTDMILLKDLTGNRLYKTEAELAATLRVSKIIEVVVMENQTRENENEDNVTLLAILVNLKDYTMGADKGGAVSMFDDFDIDYNQYKYLIETRCSGSLTVPKSAIVFEQIIAE
jgi:hypothetical protein